MSTSTRTRTAQQIVHTQTHEAARIAVAKILEVLDGRRPAAHIKTCTTSITHALITQQITIRPAHTTRLRRLHIQRADHHVLTTRHRAYVFGTIQRGPKVHGFTGTITKTTDGRWEIDTFTII